MSLQQRKIFSSLILFQGEKCRGSFSISFYSGGGEEGGGPNISTVNQLSQFQFCKSWNSFPHWEKRGQGAKACGIFVLFPFRRFDRRKILFFILLPAMASSSITLLEPYLLASLHIPYLDLNFFWGKNHRFLPPPPLYVSSRHQYRSEFD